MAKVQQPSQQQIEKTRQNRAKDLLQYILNQLVLNQQKLYCKVTCDFNIFLKVIDWKLGDCINYLATNNWRPTQIVVKLEETIKKYSPNYVCMANNYGDMTMVTFRMFKQREIEKLKNKTSTTTANTNGVSITKGATVTATDGGTAITINNGNEEIKTGETNTNVNANGANEAKTDDIVTTNLDNNPLETSTLKPDSEDDTIDNN